MTPGDHRIIHLPTRRLSRMLMSVDSITTEEKPSAVSKLQTVS